MSGVVGAWGLNSTAETEFLAAVARQSIGRPCVLRPSKNLKGPTERQKDGVKVSLRPIVRSTSYVSHGGAPRDSIFNNNQISSLGPSSVRAGNKMTTAEIPVPTEKAYHARPSHPAPSTIARTTLSSSSSSSSSLVVVPPSPNPIQQARAIPTVATMAIPTAPCLVHGEKTCQPQLPLAAATPWTDLADRWARELDAARERRKELKEQFRRDFGIGYGRHL